MLYSNDSRDHGIQWLHAFMITASVAMAGEPLVIGGQREKKYPLHNEIIL